MQLLNISVNNRPSRSVTSRPYATEFGDSVGFQVDYLSGAISSLPTDDESVGYGVSMGSCIIRDQLVKLPLQPEDVSYVPTLQGVRISYEVVYHKYDAKYDSVAYEPTLIGVQIVREVRYLSTTLTPESVGFNSTISGVKITN